MISDFAESDTSSETGTDTKDYRTCSIVINYLFDNNAIAFEPYGATIAYGEPFEAEIESPDILGYDPFRRIGDEYVRADKVLIEIDHVYENITINVIYEPALVQFQVHHHYQNLHDDQYSITADRITVGYALTGSIVPDGLALSEAELPGFKSFPYEKLSVAADGSTTIEIRYDRNYYLVDFDMNGGYGTEPVYTKYGQTVGANTPIRHGYVFDGWELVSYGGHTPTSEQTERYKIGAGVTINVPDANLRYRARWITQETTYTMVFWKENANDNGYTYWGYLDGLGAMSGSYVSAQNLISSVDGITDEQYFTFNEQRSDKNVLVEGDGSTVVNVYYTRNYYKLTIKATGLCTIPVGHTHTDDCYDLVCVAEHIHTQQCMPEIICNAEEHTEHTDECLSCTLIEHTHGSAECLCQLDEHTHTKKCWGSYVGSQASKPSSAPSSPEDGYVYRRSTYSTKYIYIKGTWYTYTGQASNKTVVTPSCSYSSEHMHGIACACDMPEHSHTASCYRDVIHTHTDVCYKYSCGMSVHTHTDSCKRLKCGIAEGHTHSSTCTKSSSTNTVDVIYKKYEQNIEDIWPITDGNGKIYNSGERWSPSDSSYYSQVLVYISQMPPDDFTLTLNEANYSTYTMQYYLEALPGNIPTDAEVITYNDRQYVLQNTIKANYNYITRAEDFFDIHGYTQYASSHSFSNDGKITISSGDKTVKFYYNRVTDHYLEFNNNGAVIDSATQYGIMYGASIRDYQFIPDYPSNLEPNAYTFGGWYTSKQCFDGTEVDWEKDTMPVGDLLLYAKWAPVKHSVNVYLDSTLSTQIGETQLVDHNAFALAPSNEITNGSYLFQGWFYLDSNGTEKAFVFTGIPIKDDMNIYAKWSSRVSVKYKIQYKLKLTGETIADVTEGDAIAGNNQTFSAKAGEQLYDGFREGYYPLTNSHTITMSAEKALHEFTFEYVFVPSMPYTVRYINKATGEDLLAPKVVDNNTHSVVTET
ncbi:MAG: InlB B-repeat-containing protein, partial [Clostridia bacterium]|nr:InlB B-repeat-containing protein [Clostridia bacterium]